MTTLTANDFQGGCSNCGFGIKGLTSNKRCPYCWNSMVNNSEEMKDSFEEQIRQHPKDPSVHHIYADYLEERGNSTEALHHRAVGKFKEALYKPRSDFGTWSWYERGDEDPSVRRTMRQGRETTRPANAKEASTTAWKNSRAAGYLQKRGSAIKAIKSVNAAKKLAAKGSNIQAAEAHEIGAIHHLHAADEIEKETKGRHAKPAQRIQDRHNKMRERGHDIPQESLDALEALNRSNREKSTQTQHEARDAAVRAMNSIRGIPGVFTLEGERAHLLYSLFHAHSTSNRMLRHIPNNGRVHRRAALANLIAARIHRGYNGPEAI